MDMSSESGKSEAASSSACSTVIEEDTSTYPDGGWRAWGVVLGAWCAMMPCYGLLNSTGVLQTWLENHQLKNYSPSTIGWIFSLYNFFFYLGSAQVGPIFDAYGLAPLLVPGCVGLVGSVMIFSVATEYYQFMLGFGVLGGISASMVLTPSVACITHWFLRRRALASGIAATAGGVGGIIFPVIISKLSPSIGFGWAVRIIGFICAANCAFCVAFLRTRLPKDPKRNSKIDIRAMKEPSYALLTLAVAFIDVALLVVLTYIPAYAQYYGMKESSAYELSSIMNGASILGRTIPGYFADRFGRFNVMIITTFVCAVITLALWLPCGSNHAAIIAYSVLYGFWSGTSISLALVCIAQISKTEDFGKRYGVTYSLVGIGTLVALPIAGQLLNTRSWSGQAENYSAVILSSGLVYCCACLLFTLSRGVNVGWKWAIF